MKRALVLTVEAIAAQFSDAELYQNDDDRKALAFAVPAGKAKTVGNGIDLERFRRDSAAGCRFRRTHGIDSETLVVGGVGRRVEEKGVLDLGRASRSIDGAEVIWVGPPDETKPDAVLAAVDGVRFIEAQTDMVAVYSAIDVFVLPSYREGFSRSAMEASACGCALVLSNIRGCREIGTDGRHLLLIDPGDPDALAHAVNSLLASPDLRSRLASAATARAHASFDQRGVAAASIAAYRSVARSRARP